MRIVYLSAAPIPSLAANAVQVLQACAALIGEGHDVRLVVARQPNRPRSDEERRALYQHYALPHEVPLVYLPYLQVRQRLQGSYFFIAAAYARLVAAELVYTRNVRIAALAARLGLPVVCESHDPPNSDAGWRTFSRLSRYPRAMFAFNTDELRRICHERVPLPEDRVCVESNAVDLHRFAQPLSPAEARAALGRSDTRRWIVHSGHLYQGRGAELLIDGLVRLPDARLVFVGGRPEDIARLRARVSSRGLDERVEFVGHRPLSELPNWLWAADVLTLPYTTQAVTSDGKTQHGRWASPMKLFEYMAAGRPIVASRMPAMHEILRDDENALLVEPDSEAALFSAIARVLGETGLADRLGQRARADIAEKGWSDRARRILDQVSHTILQP